MQQPSPSQITYFQSTILDRYAHHARNLPRRTTTDPYRIRISETMLCQTQVSRVIGYYEQRLWLFPTVEALAAASRKEVLNARSWLGYNSRAIRLHAAACQMVDDNLGFPKTTKELLALPGVGDYIAWAIMTFAYGKDVVVIDTNIRRIFLYRWWLDHQIDRKNLTRWVERCIPPGKGTIRYNALMDYGALVLTAKVTGVKSLGRQSTFGWSTRQVRSLILKQLLKGSLTVETIVCQFERDDIHSIVQRMATEWLITLTGNVLTL